MEGWKTDKLMNLVSSITTGKLDANAMVPNGQYRFYTCAKEYYNIDKYAFDDEALLISGNGEYVGYIHYYKGKFNAYQRVYVLTGFKIDVKYLQSYLNRYLSVRINKEVSQNNIPYIRLSTLSKMDIKYPESFPEQTAIANILSKVDEAIASVQSSVAATERLKKSMMQNLLTGRMKPDGTLRKDNEFYMDEKFGKVPVGWEVKKLKDVCLNSGDYGANASAIAFDETKPRFIRITDIDDYGQLLDDGKVGIDSNNYSKYLLEEDDFLFARTGDTVGKSLLYKKRMGAAVYAGYLIKFTFDKSKILPEYFDLIAKSDFFEAFKISMKRVGAKPNINSREYCSFRFLLPSDIEEQKEIYGKFANIDKSQKEKQQKIATLERLKKSLMQNLLTGKVRIIKKQKTNVIGERCYLCDEAKCSVEHVPAKCFFPEESEYRKELITVPSCKNHNENTSKDDEYVRNIICMCIGNNTIAYKQFINKAFKSFQHSPALKNQTLQKTQQIYVKEKNNIIKQALAVQIDRNRFDKVMKKIGYALYYHEYNKIWQRGLIVATEFLVDGNMRPDEFGEVVQEFKPLMPPQKFDGKNPKVFQYKFVETENEDVILWMKFYEGFEVFVVPNINTCKPDSI